MPILDGADPVPIAAQLLASAQEKAGCFPKKLFVSAEFESGQFGPIAKEIDAELASYEDEHLAPFVSEAKEGFLSHFGGGRRQ